MIVKINKMGAGWVFYSDVKKVETDTEHCFHNFGDDNVKAVLKLLDSDGTPRKNISCIHVVDGFLVNFDSQDFKKFSDLGDVYTAKLITVYQKDVITTLAMWPSNQAYLLNDSGETVEKL